MRAPTLDGDIEVKVRKTTQHGDQLRLRGRGLPRLGSVLLGDLFVRFSVSTPTNLSPRQEELLREFAEEEQSKLAPATTGETPTHVAQAKGHAAAHAWLVARGGVATAPAKKKSSFSFSPKKLSPKKSPSK